MGRAPRAITSGRTSRRERSRGAGRCARHAVAARALDDRPDHVALDDLQRRRAREVLEDLDGLGPGVLGHALGVEERLQLLERRRGGAGVGDDGRTGALAEAVVGERHDRDLVDRGVAQDHRLDLGRHDRHAAAADDVLAAPDVDELAVLVEQPEVAGAVAAPRRQRLRA